MRKIDLQDKGMEELSIFIEQELGVEVIFVRVETEEMIGFYTTDELISPSMQYVLSSVSKNHNENRYEVQFINMKLTENIHRECYFENIEEIKSLLTLIREMVKKEEEVKQRILSLIQ